MGLEYGKPICLNGELQHSLVDEVAWLRTKGTALLASYCCHVDADLLLSYRCAYCVRGPLLGESPSMLGLVAPPLF